MAILLLDSANGIFSISGLFELDLDLVSRKCSRHKIKDHRFESLIECAEKQCICMLCSETLDAARELLKTSESTVLSNAVYTAREVFNSLDTYGIGRFSLLFETNESPYRAGRNSAFFGLTSDHSSLLTLALHRQQLVSRATTEDVLGIRTPRIDYLNDGCRIVARYLLYNIIQAIFNYRNVDDEQGWQFLDTLNETVEHQLLYCVKSFEKLKFEIKEFFQPIDVLGTTTDHLQIFVEEVEECEFEQLALTATEVPYSAPDVTKDPAMPPAVSKCLTEAMELVSDMIVSTVHTHLEWNRRDQKPRAVIFIRGSSNRKKFTLVQAHDAEHFYYFRQLVKWISTLFKDRKWSLSRKRRKVETTEEDSQDDKRRIAYLQKLEKDWL